MGFPPFSHGFALDEGEVYLIILIGFEGTHTSLAEG